jgi:uncharacterized protein (TIGR03435 family)
MFRKYLGTTCASFALTAVCAFGQAVTGQTPVSPVLAAAPSAPTAPLAFEVATIKLARPLQEQALSGKMHVGVNIDAGRVDIGGMSLSDLISIAYKVKPHQISGPDWLAIDRFDILAKIPEGVDKDKVPEMMQTLLADRFKLTFHRENRDHAIYALIVGKNGPKLKESPPDPEPPKEGDAPPKEEKGVMTINNGNDSVRVKQTNNGAVINSGANGTTRMTMEDGHMKMELSKMTLEGLAAVISRFVDKPVMDMTELKGNYQMTLELTMEDLQNVARQQGMQIPGAGPAGAASNSRPAETVADPSGSSIFSTVQQMGLKLEARKAPVETIIIDHVEKAPTEN